MRKLYFTAPRQIQIREENTRQPASGEVLVQTTASAISPGTELLIYRGQAPTDMAADSTIAALGGSLDYPLTYGYAAVGRVIEAGPDVTSDWVGRTVFAFNPHQTHFTASVDTLHPLPDKTAIEDALFLPNMETAVNFMHDGRPLMGERVIIFGQGVVGLLTTALAARFPLADLIAVERYTQRQQMALTLGADDVFAPDEIQQIERRLGSRGADLVYEVSGAPQALDAAIRMAGYHSRVVIGSWYGRKPVELDLGGAFHRSRIQLISSQVSTVDPVLSGRWDKSRRFKTTWAMIKAVQPARLITHRVSFEQAAEAYRLLDEQPESAVQVVLTYDYR